MRNWASGVFCSAIVRCQHPAKLVTIRPTNSELALPKSVPTHRRPALRTRKVKQLHCSCRGACIVPIMRTDMPGTTASSARPRPIHIKPKARLGISARSASSPIEMDRVAISRQALDHTYRACSHILGRYSRRTTPLAKNEVRGKTTVACRSGDNWRRPAQDQTDPSFWFGTI